MEDRNFIAALGRSMSVLETLARKGCESTSLKEIARGAGLAKSSAFRILYTLKKLGYVSQQGENGPYSLTLKLMPLARAAHARSSFVQMVRPYLERLRDGLGESAWLGRRLSDRVLLVDAAAAPNRMKLLLEVGDLCPVHATALGKCVAAFVDGDEREKLIQPAGLPRFTDRTITEPDALGRELLRVRREGWAINDEETIEGSIVIGAPLFDASQTVVGAISVSSLADRCGAPCKRRIREAVQAAAQQASQEFAALARPFVDVTARSFDLTLGNREA